MRIVLCLVCLVACLPDSLPGDGDGDGYTYAIDCDDADPNVGPAEEGEECDRTQDSAEPLDTNDRDYDGFSEAQGDCDDTDPNVSPTASDIVGDDIDQNCDGVDGTDNDGDGFASAVSGGDDCDDADAAINPDATEIAWNDIDEDCSGKDLHDYLQISTGAYHACGVASTGNIVCWGSSYSSPEVHENRSGDHASVKCGSNKTCTIDNSAYLECYGDFVSTYTDPPSGSGYASIDLEVMNNYPICAIKSDGSLDCGYCPDQNSSCQPPSGEFAEVNTFSGRACAVTTLGEISCWGNPTPGAFESDIPDDTGFHNLEMTGQSSACVLREDGALHCWGTAYTTSSPMDEPGSNGPFTQLSTRSTNDLCAIKEADKSLWCQGMHPGLVPTGEFTQVSIGYQYACALDTLGEAHCWELHPWQPADYGLTDPP